MAKVDLKRPDRYVNRELSWLEFNDRVLGEGRDESVPLLERLKFLAIVSSNLDEFFMIRVAGLKQLAAAGVRRPDLAGLSPAEQLDRIRTRARRLVADQADAIRNVTARLREHGLRLLELEEVPEGEPRRFLASYFRTEILSSLTPLAVEEMDPAPILPGLTLYLALLTEPETAGPRAAGPKLAVVPVPGGLPRFITVPAERDVHLVRLEDVMAAHVGDLLPGCRVVARAPFRLTRDADVAVDEDDAEELLEAMEEAVLARKRRAVVRLAMPAGTDPRLKGRLLEWLGAGEEDLYEVDGMLDAASLMEVANRPGYEKLRYPEWPVQPARDLVGKEDLWTALQEDDVLLFHPYETFDPIVQLLEGAADDPNVLAIKQTLYRTSGDSPIIRALARAAENGKQVTVLVELKARFDEAKNVRWARRLEDAGCYVIYGIAGYKTHAKALLIVRREAHLVRRYLHLGTGNYHDKTAKLYSDIGLLTSDADLASDAAALFNLLTGASQEVGWSKLVIAPTGLRKRFLDMIERETQAATPDEPGRILAKVNSLHDRAIAEALYRASRAGVRVRLNVRGICCLRPGIEGVSENIEVVSIVDRYLEHARVFYFHNGGHEEVYLSSADWMVRNLDKRLETLFPVQDPDLKRRIIRWLETCMADNVKARRMRPDGTYERVETRGEPVRAQEVFWKEAAEAVREAQGAPLEFRPLARPED